MRPERPSVGMLYTSLPCIPCSLLRPSLGSLLHPSRSLSMQDVLSDLDSLLERPLLSGDV